MIKQKNTYDYQVIRAIERKLYLINLRGGCCEQCGYDKNLSALEFHHKNPLEKDSNLDSRHLSNRTMKWILKEFDKCQVLCANCHREHHHPNTTIIYLKERIDEFKNAIKIPKGKPKCIDCGTEINYTYSRCTLCQNINKRKVIRPSIEILKQEIDDIGIVATGRKYGVSHTSIRRWIRN